MAWGEIGELVIGGVGLGRYLDPAKDRQKYAPVPSLGWKRGYRSGDLVRADPAGLLFVGRATRSSWAAGGSNSERSTRRCGRCRGCVPPRLP